jgi:N-acetylglutamate synthase-like GNAT family acetyltransferase
MHNFPAVGNHIRLVQARDLEVVHQLGLNSLHSQTNQTGLGASWLPSSLRALVGDRHRTYVLESGAEIVGCLRVAPINSQRSAWQMESMAIAQGRDTNSCGTQLIRHCLEVCYEARNWLVQVDVNQKQAIALYRTNGFQPLAHLTDWQISSHLLQELAQRSPDLPNLLPISNSDASLLYQLDIAAMPPQLRQVYDLTVQDFRSSPIEKVMGYGYHLLNHLQEVSGYIYETQRKAAIGYFDLVLDRSPHSLSPTHHCQMTVHPAYTWLYPELMAQVANTTVSLCGTDNLGKLRLTSADYQPEREAYLEQIQAERLGHTLLMARSVWHKVREARPMLDALQLSKMLAGLQPAQKPVPGRIDG